MTLVFGLSAVSYCTAQLNSEHDQYILNSITSDCWSDTSTCWSDEVESARRRAPHLLYGRLELSHSVAAALYTQLNSTRFNSTTANAHTHEMRWEGPASFSRMYWSIKWKPHSCQQYSTLCSALERRSLTKHCVNSAQLDPKRSRAPRAADGRLTRHPLECPAVCWFCSARCWFYSTKWATLAA